MAEPRDWITDEFADLCSRAATQVRPPGIDVTVRTVRRRRIRNRATTAAISVLAVAAIAAGLLAMPGSRGEPPIDRVTPSPSASPSGSASPQDVVPVGASPEAPASPTNPGDCIHFVELLTTGKSSTGPNSVNVTVEVHKRPSYTIPTCPDAPPTRVQWVSYSGDEQGNMRLYRTYSTSMGLRSPPVQLHIELPGSCGDTWYAVFGDVTIRSSLQWPVGKLVYGPYNGRTLAYDELKPRSCLPTYVPPSPTPSPTP